ncbi:hypothetical protein AVEN_140464-1 [Araneus ventricosus]|uniref:Reverse transcriptase Ty1/copia-type domain-containing protein n=1 Tax=Araneus ventricosus TaxID=182803 RepID=A0A4Y2JFQ4_ARAVE|nr:hypothetical protein AVEN_140464-1 [Araneus ventricosus]
MSCKWVLHIKRKNVYKARLVARGFEQKPGIDYFETYAPVIKLHSIFEYESESLNLYKESSPKSAKVNGTSFEGSLKVSNDLA